MTTPLDAFGPGIIIVTRTDVANATPVNIGYAQEFTPEFSGSIKELFGQNQLPLDAARGTIKVTGKIKAAVLSGLAWNNVFFGDTFSTGGIIWNVNEAKTIASGTFTLTNAGTFDADLGVVYASSNLPFVKVASLTGGTGQYTQSGATYNFNSGDNTAAVLVTYTSTTASGQQLAVNNQLLGYAPTFQLDYYTSRNNKPFVARYYSCQASKLSFAAKLEDFIMPEFDFSMFVNSAGQLGKLVFPEIS
jgi:hypothetical protein